MAVAYWMAHAPQSFFPVLNGGDAAILYCFVFLYLVLAGGGLEPRRDAGEGNLTSLMPRPRLGRTAHVEHRTYRDRDFAPG